MKPEKEIALVIACISLTICVSELKIIWNRINDVSENKITYRIFVTKSLKLELYSLKVLINSTGINNKKIAAKKSIRNQNKPWPFHEVILGSTLPTDSRRR